MSKIVLFLNDNFGKAWTLRIRIIYTSNRQCQRQCNLSISRIDVKRENVLIRFLMNTSRFIILYIYLEAHSWCMVVELDVVVDELLVGFTISIETSVVLIVFFAG